MIALAGYMIYKHRDQQGLEKSGILGVVISHAGGESLRR
jgi:hypothetical protein